MQKMIYLSNCKDFTNQSDINENKYFKRVNELLEQGWKVEHVTHKMVEFDITENSIHKETFVAIVLLGKADEKQTVEV